MRLCLPAFGFATHAAASLAVRSVLSVAALTAPALAATSTNAPAILQDTDVQQRHYLPDYSYAGYHWGEQQPEVTGATVIDVTDYGAKPDDNRDDSAAFQKALAAAHKVSGPVVVDLPPGKFILSEILYIERSHFVLRGAGSGATVLSFPRPLMYVPDPEDFKELRQYLVDMDKRQREKHNNIDLPYSQYSWAGGFIWTRIPGERVKAYLDEYHQPQRPITTATAGKRGSNALTVEDASALKAGDVVRINWYNKEGKDGPLLDQLYQGADVTIGSHHWTQPNQPLVSQQVQVTRVEGKQVTIKDTLLHDIPSSGTEIASWPYLEEVGIEHLRLEFPNAPPVAHHVEQGYNGLFLTQLFNSWVRDLHIHNADSGILTEEVVNTTIENVTTSGQHLAHYSVAMGNTHNVLVKNLRVFNPVRHPLSFNTYSTRSVYTQSEVFQEPVLDQHSGANHQNLFDAVTVHVSLTPEQQQERRFPLLKGGGAGYWKPTHAAFNTIWNLYVQVTNLTGTEPLTLYGVNDGPHARLIGIHGNVPLQLDYGPQAYIEGTNHFYRGVPSLYEYQLNQRLQQQAP